MIHAADLQPYLDAVAAVLETELDAQLVGLYLFGSAAYGAYEPGRSDLDLQAVVRHRPPAEQCRRLAHLLSVKQLPCPARKLEFVLYTAGAVAPAQRHPRFAMNFNTGGGQPDLLQLDAEQTDSHWFLLDIAMGRAVGQALRGPPPGDVFALIPYLWVLEAVLDSLTWHLAHERDDPNTVLNACRGWRYAMTGIWGSKQEGGTWAEHRRPDLSVIGQALSARMSGTTLPPHAVLAFTALVRHQVQACLERFS
ncbi:aminoglycoside adenylyltransferase domain-containing protein [Deinococcus sonorensis]|uniref:aminoglycoside adenylyltransferase domain-containing protein n=1 Tax=Deinococcus sonorensis TaxID=309891 RepID=UPI0036D356F1